ncbi:MAG TPA: GGDEF domain-containing protein [Solirubrobacteraceae bacterium]|nr:GGDEF domain-containing protein [Solirubrobacteraceae bacterium]
MELGLRRVRAHASAVLLAASASLLAGSIAFARLGYPLTIATGVVCVLSAAGVVMTWRSGERFGDVTLAGLVVVATGLLTLAAVVNRPSFADLVVLFLLAAIFGACFLAARFSILVLVICCGAYGWLVNARPPTEVTQAHWTTATLVLASAVAAVWVLRRRLTAAHDELARLATCDPLTGLLNRRGFDQRVGHEIERHRRSSEPFSILLCDLDHFKGINDRHGHAVGDGVLTRVAATLLDGVRTIDAVARVGGEEIAVLLVHCDRAGAYSVAERLREAVAEAHGGDPAVTISIGIAEAGPDELPAQLYARADGALYDAKRAGRNCVRAAEPAAAAAAAAAGGASALGLVA